LKSLGRTLFLPEQAELRAENLKAILKQFSKLAEAPIDYQKVFIQALIPADCNKESARILEELKQSEVMKKGPVIEKNIKILSYLNSRCLMMKTQSNI
jgi:hypothetical protein